MVSRKLQSEIEEYKAQRKWFWGLVVSLISITHGIYYVSFSGSLLRFVEPSLHFLPEREIGWALIILGTMKIVGMVFKVGWLRAIGIWGMSIVWGGLFFTAFAYSFGTGYPSSYWVDRLLLVIMCLRISLKGANVDIWKSQNG